MNPGMILVQRLRSIDDPRVTGRCDHALVDILVIALCAIMAGAEGWDDIEAWGEANEERLGLYLGLSNGIPGHDTIRRVFEAIDPKRLEAVLLEWIGHVCPALGKVIAIDGKSVRGSGSILRSQRALHVVSAYASEVGLVLGQQRCEEKSNEITAQSGTHRLHRDDRRDGMSDSDSGANNRAQRRLFTQRQGQSTQAC